MCGIVGAVAQRNVTPILLEGLKRLEYRGYDSAGIAVIDNQNEIKRCRTKGKVQELANSLEPKILRGTTGIAHTRWATHGKPSIKNAHPHICKHLISVVHNGIIENHQKLREQQKSEGHIFTSETDTEVVVHQVYNEINLGNDLLQSVINATSVLEGAYALGVISNAEPNRLIATRKGSPLVIGIGIEEFFIASDVFALLPVTRQFIFLEEGDIADITIDELKIYDSKGNIVQRETKETEISSGATGKGEYKHYMLKEIHEQANVIAETCEGRISDDKVLSATFGVDAQDIFKSIDNIQIVACGTSFHAGLVARYWFEEYANISCSIEVASEFRYRKQVVKDNTLLITISQSGETADTLAALRIAKQRGYTSTLAICNVPESSLVRESDLVLMTRAGPEIGVASTKAFTTQLVAFLLLVIGIGKQKNCISSEQEAYLVSRLKALPQLVKNVLMLDEEIKEIATEFANCNNALFLGRGSQYPIAMEGALKLKEISYIHAEAYPAGELKHGPLALVDEHMPVIAVAPNDDLLDKLKSNLEEVHARAGKLLVFADSKTQIEESEGLKVIRIGEVNDCVAPILFTLPLQLLSYHVAVTKGTDIDQPRNLAKSVTVE
ncbi:MAG: glutamine--fructose-6-phosphate transaminase (isomerizing) [Methylococcales bacterium]|jgi:glutamine---fructose-6-phosphate transaminase (isomerizing)|nr:glutamine--fructose-6-phosphate transaminase (isomerizing) [Methylococcales bacterium]MBT7411293.1 glutamine--fructose-6-phosphate transaminase (isomerizing) [Methylococcales bacterium]